MDTVVVDTCVVSFLHKNHENAELYRSHLEGSRLLVISFMTLAELYRWAAERNWGERRVEELDKRLEDYVIYSVNRPLCRMWATITAEASNSGTPIAVGDAWIAATALLYDFPLVTHNRKDFEVVPGLRVVSEAP
jgi:tRNA(fMet)-specific endonuclease VapC